MLRYFNVVVLAAAIGGGLGFLTYCRLPTEYTSSARLVVAAPSQASDAPAGGHRTEGQSPVELATQELTSEATLDRAIENSELMSLAPVVRGAFSVDQIRQSLEVDSADEPDHVVVIHCHAPTAKAAQTILTSVIDAYLVLDSDRRRKAEADLAALVEQFRGPADGARHAGPAIGRAQKLLDTWLATAANPASMERMSQRRAALLLRRNDLERQLAAIERGSAASRRPANSEGQPGRSAPSPSLIKPDLGAQQRTSQLLEEDAQLALKYGPEHPKRKAIRQELELLEKYPAEQAQLLAERSRLIEQFGPDHPRLKAIDQRLAQLGIEPPPASAVAVSLPVSASSEAMPEIRRKALRAAIEELDVEDRAITQQTEMINAAHDVAAELRQAAGDLDDAAGRPARSILAGALQRALALQTAVRPYLAMRATPGVRSDAGPTGSVLRGAAIGAAIGGVLSLIIALMNRASAGL